MNSREIRRASLVALGVSAALAASSAWAQNAGESPKEKLDATLLTAEIEKAYVLWGLSEVGGLELDGIPATPESLVSHAPESLFREALEAVKAECGLSDEERKN